MSDEIYTRTAIIKGEERIVHICKNNTTNKFVAFCDDFNFTVYRRYSEEEVIESLKLAIEDRKEWEKKYNLSYEEDDL